MPQGIVGDQQLLPEDTLFRGVLSACTDVDRSWDDKYTGQRVTKKKWSWTFQVTDGDYAGSSAKIETFPELYPGSDNHNIISALLGRELQKGEKVNTDQYLGMFCTFEVSHRSFNGRNGEKTIAEVTQVYPDQQNMAASSQPPF